MDALWDLESLKKLWHSLFYDWKHHLEPLGRGGAVKIFSQSTLNESISNKAVCRKALATPGLLIKCIYDKTGYLQSPRFNPVLKIYTSTLVVLMTFSMSALGQSSSLHNLLSALHDLYIGTVDFITWLYIETATFIIWRVHWDSRLYFMMCTLRQSTSLHDVYSGTVNFITWHVH